LEELFKNFLKENNVTIEDIKHTINKTIFCHSIIDHTTMNNPNCTLKETITNNQTYPTTMKTVVDDNVFPKTSNTFLTCYYTSYIQSNISPSILRKPLLRCYCTNQNKAIQISVIGTTYFGLSQLYIEIYNSSGDIYNAYTITTSEPKVVIDLTADLAAARREQEKNISAQFSVNDFGGDLNNFYQHCINILSNVFISYTYDE
jgi:hypothetical protein